jgi:hypothetical protein
LTAGTALRLGRLETRDEEASPHRSARSFSAIPTAGSWLFSAMLPHRTVAALTPPLPQSREGSNKSVQFVILRS